MSAAVNPARFGARAAQPLDDFTRDAKSVLEGLFGQSSEKDLPAFARAQIEATRKVREAAARIAATADGADLLEALCDATLRRPVFVTQFGVDPQQALLMGAFREGQNAAIFMLLAWIAEGRSERPVNREGSHELEGRSSGRIRRRATGSKRSR